MQSITLEIRAGEHYGLWGGNGSGKTTLLRLIAGQLWPDPETHGVRTYELGHGAEQDAVTAREKIRVIGPALHDQFQQRRLNLNVASVVATGYTDSPIPRRRLDAATMRGISKSLLRVGALALADRRFLELSRGEQRRVLIARALVSDPTLLCLDEICDGLDLAATRRLLVTLERLTKQGITLVMATHHMEEVPPSVNRWVELRAGSLLLAPPAPTETTNIAIGEPSGGTAAALIEVRNAEVYRGGQRVLKKINWQLNAGDSWLIVGRNGVGKSTFLKLLNAELRPALGGSIRWFQDDRRVNVWALRQRIAVVSDELQALHAMGLTVRDCVATGLVSSIGRVPSLTRAQNDKIDSVLQQFDLERLARHCVRNLSYGRLRRILLARALVVEPSVLLLDEPYSGLDTATQAMLTREFSLQIKRGVSLVLTTHRQSALSRLCNRKAEIENGRLRVID